MSQIVTYIKLCHQLSRLSNCVTNCNVYQTLSPIVTSIKLCHTLSRLSNFVTNCNVLLYTHLCSRLWFWVE